MRDTTLSGHQREWERRGHRHDIEDIDENKDHTEKMEHV